MSLKYQFFPNHVFAFYVMRLISHNYISFLNPAESIWGLPETAHYYTHRCRFQLKTMRWLGFRLYLRFNSRIIAKASNSKKKHEPTRITKTHRAWNLPDHARAGNASRFEICCLFMQNPAEMDETSET
jgi:hypothetical protein